MSETSLHEYDILHNRICGASLQSLAGQYGLSRERIRQISNQGIKKALKNFAADYSGIFKWQAMEWCRTRLPDVDRRLIRAAIQTWIEPSQRLSLSEDATIRLDDGDTVIVTLEVYSKLRKICDSMVKLKFLCTLYSFVGGLTYEDVQPMWKKYAKERRMTLSELSVLWVRQNSHSEGTKIDAVRYCDLVSQAMLDDLLPASNDPISSSRV